MSHKYKENGLYIGNYGGDFYIFRIDWINDELTWKDYEQKLNQPVYGQPLSGKSSPFQWIYPNSVKDIQILTIYNQPEEESFIMWMNYSFNWSKVMIRWLNEKHEYSYGYVKSFNEELQEQWENN